MAEVTFASSIQRHVPSPTVRVGGATVRDALEAVFAENEPLRGYVLDDQGHLRHHVALFVDGRQVSDPQDLTDTVSAKSRIHVIQALSGG